MSATVSAGRIADLSAFCLNENSPAFARGNFTALCGSMDLRAYLEELTLALSRLRRPTDKA